MNGMVSRGVLSIDTFPLYPLPTTDSMESQSLNTSTKRYVMTVVVTRYEPDGKAYHSHSPWNASVEVGVCSKMYASFAFTTQTALPHEY